MFSWINSDYKFELNCNFSYAVGDSNINDSNYEKLSQDLVPDVILVKKFYGHDKSARRRARLWRLKHLAEDVISMSTENKYVTWPWARYNDSVLTLEKLQFGARSVKLVFKLDFFFSAYNEFLEDLEEDPEMRQNINIFRDSKKQIPVDDNDILDPSIPQVTLEEMLDDLFIDDVEMQEV